MGIKTLQLMNSEYTRFFVDEKIKDQLHAEKIKLTNMLLPGLISERIVMTKNEWSKLEGEVIEKKLINI